MGRRSALKNPVKKVSAEVLEGFTIPEREAARYMAGLYTYSKAVQAVVIAWFCGREEYYRVIGYSTEQEFMEIFAGKSYSQGKKYKEIGKIFLNLFPLNLEDANSQLLAVSAPPGSIPLTLTKSEDFQRLSQFIQQIGIEKFYELTQYKLDYSEIKQGIVKLPDGQEISAEDMINTETRALLSKIDDLERGLSEKRRELTEVRTTSEERIKKLESEKERLADLERMYGEKAVHLEEKREYLAMGKKLYEQAIEILFRIKLTEEDPEALIYDVRDTLKGIDRGLKRLRDEFGLIIVENANED